MALAEAIVPDIEAPPLNSQKRPLLGHRAAIDLTFAARRKVKPASLTFTYRPGAAGTFSVADCQGSVGPDRELRSVASREPVHNPVPVEA